MKKQLLLPLAAGVSGIAAFVLRLVQYRTGFEADTGLPVPGHPAGIALVVLLVAMAAVLAVLARKLPAGSPAFPADFSTADVNALMLPMAGVFLMGLSGAMELLSGIGILGGGVELPGIGTLALVSVPGSRQMLLTGLLSLGSAGALFLSLVRCRVRSDREAQADGGVWLLVPVVMLVIRLVLTYRTVSVNPSLAAYYVELLALAFLSLGFYRLSSFAFSASRPRLFAFYAGESVIFPLAAAAGGCAPASALLYLGGGAVLLGCLLLLLADVPAES